MEIRDRIKKLFGRQEVQPVIETSQRYPIPAGFIDNTDIVLAFMLKKGKKFCGVNLYTFKEDGVSLEKHLLGSMDENQWRDFKSKLKNAKTSGFIENDERIPIPRTLCEGQSGVYAVPIKRFFAEYHEKDGKVRENVFINDGVNIYQTDENMRSNYVRSMNKNVWKNYSLLIKAAQKEEEEIRQASLSKFAVLSEK